MQTKRFSYWQAIDEQIQQLSDEDAGAYIKAMGDYAFRGKEPSFDNQLLAFAWPFTRDQIGESVDVFARNYENGIKGGRPKKTNGKTTPKTTPKTNPKTDPKTDPETEKKERKGKKTESLSTFLSSADDDAFGGASSATEGLLRDKPFDTWVLGVDYDKETAAINQTDGVSVKDKDGETVYIPKGALTAPKDVEGE